MNVQCHCCIGGMSIGEDIRKLDYGQVRGSGGLVGKVAFLLRSSPVLFTPSPCSVCLNHPQHIVSGTPGRVFDMIQRRNLRTR